MTRSLSGEPYSTINSNVAGEWLGSVVLAAIKTDNGAPFGVAARRLGKLTRVEGRQKTAWDEDWQDDRDFTIRLL